MFNEALPFVSPVVLIAAFIAAAIVTKMVLNLRRVVSTNEVHIVQASGKTTSYGNKEATHGNTYYEWPSWLPVLGVQKTVLPLSVFDLDLPQYEAYDSDRLPFVVHIKAFFRIVDSNKAAERVRSFEELNEQLKAVVQGAVRVILSSHTLEEIMQGRSKFGEAFTKEVHEQVLNWGVDTVKNLELMDLRDSGTSLVIQNIMAKKQSQIDMESRSAVALNKKMAEVAEIESKREVDLQKQQALQTVGLRTVEAERNVSLQREEMAQVVKEQQRLTKEKEMAVIQVEMIKKAEINKSVQIVNAQQTRDTTVLLAQGQKDSQVLTAEGQLESKKRESEGIALEGQARAAAEQAMLMAPVNAQTKLAQEIGTNTGYQQYLVTIRQVEATQAVGIEQAKALAAADIKVIANTSNGPAAGIKDVSELFSAKGGSQFGAMLEGLANTERGQAAMTALGIAPPTAPNGHTNGKAKT